MVYQELAHNAKFDIAMLEAEGIEVPRHICTLRVARHLDKGNVIPEYNLQFLRYYLDLEIEGRAHDAEGDVVVLEGVFNRLLAKLTQSEGSEDKAIEKMIDLSNTPILFEKLNFGKYKDKSLEYVLQNDRKYLEWLLNAKNENKDNEEDWIHTLDHYLSKK